MPKVECGCHGDPDGHLALVRRGPIVSVSVGFDEDYSPGRRPKVGLRCDALVDTGAQECCIDSTLAEELGLPIMDQRVVAGSNGRHPSNIHMAQVHVPDLDFTIYGHFGAVNIKDSGMTCRVLIGRTFLRHFKLRYDGISGRVTLVSPNDPYALLHFFSRYLSFDTYR